MRNLKELENLLTRTRKKIVFAGIGNVLRSDDGAGVYIVKHLIENERISKLLAEVSLENYVSRINRMHADILVIVDCIDFKQEPGYCALLLPEETYETTVNTHNLTLKKIADFFTMPVYILGIQPLNLRIGEEMSAPVKKAADEIIQVVNRSIGNPIQQVTTIMQP